MGHPGESWYQRIERRWLVRSALRQPALPYVDHLDRLVVVPADLEGRPGYTVQSAGGSRAVRRAGTCATEDFVVKVGPGSHLVAVCGGQDDEAGDVLARAAEGLEHMHAQHREVGAMRTLAEPYGTTLAGGPAAAVELEISHRSGRSLRLTETSFWHAGWWFSVGLYETPDDRPASTALARQVLASWSWLPVEP